MLKFVSCSVYHSSDVKLCFKQCVFVSLVMLNSVSCSVYNSSDIKLCFKQCVFQSSDINLSIMQCVSFK